LRSPYKAREDLCEKLRKGSNEVYGSDGRGVAQVEKLLTGKDDVDEREKQRDRYIPFSQP